MINEKIFPGFKKKIIFEKKSEIFLKKSFLLCFGISICAIAIGTAAKTDLLYITLFCFASFPLSLFLNYFFDSYLFEMHKRKKEELVPDLLLQASAFPRGLSMNKVLGFFAQSDFGLLGKEFETALAEIEKGMPVEQALDNIKKRCKSTVIGRAIGLLKRGYESGADLSSVFRASAEDFFETNSLLRERNAALVIEKYTLLFAGGLIVPAVLGLLTGMVSGIDLSGLEALEIGSGSAGKKELLETALFAGQIYLAEYALLAGFFVAEQEGNAKKAILYLLLLLPLSFSVNAIAKMIF